MNLSKETNFFHSIAPLVINLVRDADKEIAIAEDKALAGDYSTQVDVDVENLIVSELNKHFSEDQILAEENHSDTEIPSDRIWLIDPICGTNNLGKGINNFCTNIALVNEGVVIAACVIDHSNGEYLWSIGENTVYVNSKPYVAPSPDLGQKIDIDFGSLKSVDDNMRIKHNKLLLKLVQLAKYDLVSLNTSLSFAYTAIGKIDGFVNADSNPWDVAAAAFLIQQAGGTITGLDGSDWSVTTKGCIAARTPEMHKKLVELFNQNG